MKYILALFLLSLSSFSEASVPEGFVVVDVYCFGKRVNLHYATIYNRDSLLVSERRLEFITKLSAASSDRAPVTAYAAVDSETFKEIYIPDSRNCVFIEME